MKQSYCTLADIFPTLKEDFKMKGPVKQKQDKSDIKKDMKTVKKTDKKDNAKGREGIKDRR
jgi:hypothetical protein